MIAAFRDEEGLRVAAAELFEEAFDAPTIRKNEEIVELCEGQIEIETAPSRRTLAEGYYLWLGYVLENVDRPLELGVQFSEGSLCQEEVVALQIIRDARDDFRRKHPPCRGCGKPLRNEWDSLCAHCQHEAAKGSR